MLSLHLIFHGKLFILSFVNVERLNVFTVMLNLFHSWILLRRNCCMLGKNGEHIVRLWQTLALYSHRLKCQGKDPTRGITPGLVSHGSYLLMVVHHVRR